MFGYVTGVHRCMISLGVGVQTTLTLVALGCKDAHQVMLAQMYTHGLGADIILGNPARFSITQLCLSDCQTHLWNGWQCCTCSEGFLSSVIHLQV